MSESPPPTSKLFIRSEVLAVVEYLSVVETPSKQDRIKQIRRLSEIADRKTVLSILIKELQRTSSQSSLQAITELCMELGSIEHLHDPLWEIIQNPKTSDEMKDTANLILRHLGDESDPELYLEYLDDPHGLINRETERMLEVAAKNPEALIDFIDFIYSLPVDEQLNLLSSLHVDYSSDYLLNILIPIFMSEPPPEVAEMIIRSIGNIRHKRSAVFLYDLQNTLETTIDSENTALKKLVRHAINELRIAGVYKDAHIETFRSELSEPHALLKDSIPYKCYMTLPDGIGNQGIIISRKQHNGDICTMSVAINDMHGIIDCFGFYQLSDFDFVRITDKFHEENCKTEVDPGYCRYKLEQAEAISKQNQSRIPYEYTCWRILLEDFPSNAIDTLSVCSELAKPEWLEQCSNLYRHPDFETWFLEEGDHPVVTEVLNDITELTEKAVKTDQAPEEFLKIMDRYALGLVMALMTTPWREMIVQRLADTAFLLNTPDTKTFASLAATEVMKLVNYSSEDEQKVLNVGFILQFGRRCIEEQLLKMQQQANPPKNLTPLLKTVIR